MRYQWNGESMATDVVSALVAGLTGYAATRMALNNKAKCATITNGVLGVGGLIVKNYVGSPMAHEIFEALGYGGFAGLGAWSAAYMDNKTSIPVWSPKSTQASVVAAVPRYFPPAAPAAAPAPAVSGGNYEFEY
jgi:hypothetical protein